MTNAHCCFQTVKTLRNYVSILKVHITVLVATRFYDALYLPTPVFVFVFQGNAQKMQQYKLVTCPSATQQIHLLRASTQELLHHPVLRPECKMYFCRNISNYIDVLFVEFYDRQLQIGLLTFVHFPPPFRCFHHRSFNICNLPPSCNCRIALLIGVRNGESKIENCVIVYELCLD